MKSFTKNIKKSMKKFKKKIKKTATQPRTPAKYQWTILKVLPRGQNKEKWLNKQTKHALHQIARLHQIKISQFRKSEKQYDQWRSLTLKKQNK